MGLMGALVNVNAVYKALTFHRGIVQEISDFETHERIITAELRADGYWGKPAASSP